MIDLTAIDEAELGRWTAVHNAVRPQDPVTPGLMIDWRNQSESMLWLIASVDGVAAGVGLGVIGWHAEPGVARIDVEVLEEWRGRGVGGALLDGVSAWARDGAQTHVDGQVDELDASSLAWAGRRGFSEVGRNSTLSLDLSTAAWPEIDPPPGITITSWADKPDAVRGMYEVACEASVDIPGEEDSEVPSFDEWLANDMSGAGDRREATFVALAGDEVVGFAKLSLSEARSEIAYHDITGVKRAWRRRGIAGALKRAEIAWAIEMGYEKLETYNEARNEPIRVLNERHGYVVEPGQIRVRAALSDAS